MSSPSLVNRLGSWFNRAESRNDSSELSLLKKKVHELERELENVKKSASSGSSGNGNGAQASPISMDASEWCALRDEIELLRNEMQENIAAIVMAAYQSAIRLSPGRDRPARRTGP